MPNGWVHAAIDLIAFGRPYFDLHQKKDKAHETLGPDHRSVNHEWYQRFEKDWTFYDPFPNWMNQSIQNLSYSEGADRAEKQMSSIAHEYFDRVWDSLSESERKYWESFFIWVLSRTEVLRDKLGVDILNGKIHRIMEGQEIWEDCPNIKYEYERLCRYVKVVKKNDALLEDMLEHYG